MPEDQTKDQSDEYKYLNVVDDVGNLPGANREANVLEMVLVEEVDANITSDRTRSLGTVSLDITQIPLDVDLAAQSGSKIAVDPQGNVGLLNLDGDQIQPPTEGTLSSIDGKVATETTLGAIASALASNGTDTLQTEPQTPVGVEDTTATQVDPATEPTLSAIASALESNNGDALITQRQERKAENPTVNAGDVYHVESGETWVVDDLTVNGTLDVRGTLEHYGTITGTGSVTGNGTITQRST